MDKSYAEGGETFAIVCEVLTAVILFIFFRMYDEKNALVRERTKKHVLENSHAVYKHNKRVYLV